MDIIVFDSLRYRVGSCKTPQGFIRSVSMGVARGEETATTKVRTLEFGMKVTTLSLDDL